MNSKEVGELRRRLRPERNAISRIYGCYVNGSSREIISCLDQSLGLLPQAETEKYLGLLKKCLSGQIGKNLIDISFSTQQVASGEEHRLLTELRQTGLAYPEVRQSFYQKVIDCLDLEGTNYLILLVHDSYDVPYRGKDGDDFRDGSDQVFSYILCAICPVKEGKSELGWFPGEDQFHSCSPVQTVAQPELGFLFPAFDQRSANIYNALYYSRSGDAVHQEFVDTIFHTQPPMPVTAQRTAFESALADAMEGPCPLDVAQSVHEQLRERIELHKESRDPELLELSCHEVGAMLSNSGATDRQVDAFQKKCGQEFGQDAPLNPANLIDAKRFHIKAGEVTITLPPEQSYLAQVRQVDGRSYFLIPADQGVEVNGMAVSVQQLQTAGSTVAPALL